MAERTSAGETRRAVMAQLLKRGPVTASELGEVLHLSAAGVRRHLDALVGEGFAEECEANAVAGSEAARGRPAKHFRLTDTGRAQFGTGYDDLARDAVDVLESLGGEEAVRNLASARFRKMLAGVRTDGAVEDVIHEVAAALEKNGYATTVTRAAGGIQLCQHHCPVAAVAAEHPEMCEAEHELIAELVGSHIQPLALIADGNGICTTNIPLSDVGQPTEPSTKSFQS